MQDLVVIELCCELSALYRADEDEDLSPAARNPSSAAGLCLGVFQMSIQRRIDWLATDSPIDCAILGGEKEKRGEENRTEGEILCR